MPMAMPTNLARACARCRADDDGLSPIRSGDHGPVRPMQDRVGSVGRENRSWRTPACNQDTRAEGVPSPRRTFRPGLAIDPHRVPGDRWRAAIEMRPGRRCRRGRIKIRRTWRGDQPRPAVRRARRLRNWRSASIPGPGSYGCRQCAARSRRSPGTGAPARRRCGRARRPGARVRSRSTSRCRVRRCPR